MIKENYLSIISEIPEGVTLIVAAKTRTKEEVKELIEAGAFYIGENYVQEAEKMKKELGDSKIKWHLIGNLQKGKINKAIEIFDLIQSIDSFELAEAINARLSKIMPVLIEINSAREWGKSGVYPENAEELIRKISLLKNLRIRGLMTMGPAKTAKELRPYFKETKDLFDRIKEMKINNVDMDILSMGMSNSYKVAIEEGSNMIRVGTSIFGKRK